jgi:hypothetical protein
MASIVRSPALSLPPSPVCRPSFLSGAVALAERDLILIRRSIFDLAVRSLFQPFLFVLVFTYVYPKIGTSLAPGGDVSEISTIVVGGLAGFSAMFCGVYAVGMPLAVDLGLTREIDDLPSRCKAPIPAAGACPCSPLPWLRPAFARRRWGWWSRASSRRRACPRF